MLSSVEEEDGRGEVEVNFAENEFELVMQERTRITQRKPRLDDDYFAVRSMDSFVEKDKNRDKTFSRHLVENYLSKYKWYYRPSQDPQGPDLLKAWAYYEHVTLARFEAHSEEQQKLVMAEPGDNGDTHLFHPLKTPSSALGEWGIGVGMYFSTLSKVSFLLFLSGIIMLANLAYYSGPTYGSDYDSSNLLLKGTAVCLRKEWVVCENCKQEDWKANPEQYAFMINHTGNVFTQNDFDEKNLTFVQHNLCKGAEMGQSMVTFSAILFLFLSFAFLDWYLRQLEVRFDENWMTASDYSICVRNPPKDAKDPEEWKAFFDKWAQKQVTCCTIALDNEELLSALIQRRTYKFELDKILSFANIDADLDDDVEAKKALSQFLQKSEGETKSFFESIFNFTILPLLRFFKLAQPKPEILVQEIIRLKEKIIELEKKSYNAISVFITFETQEGQRLALRSLDISTINKFTKSSDNIVMPALFRGKHILEVQQAPEPNVVRWLELHCKLSTRLMQRTLTLAITLGLAALSSYLIFLTRRRLGAFAAAVFLSVANFFIPNVVKFMIQLIEKHYTDNSYQKSLFLKISTFRWIGSVFLIDLISETTTTLQDGTRDLLPSVGYVFISELIVTPLLQIIDFEGIFKKHIVAPRAKTQREMNLAFSGTYYNIGERYTDLTKIVALAVYYSSLFPISLIFGSVILFVQYHADKFCLMRVWSKAPFVGPEIAHFCRRYFFNTALLLFAIVTTYKYALFPYDNICFPIEASGEYQGEYNVRLSDAFQTERKIEVARSSTVKFCNQFDNILEGFFNPWHSEKHPIDSKWMTESQEKTANIFGVFTLIVVFYFFLTVFGTKFFRVIKHCFQPSYEPRGKDQQIDFSNLTEQATVYVPQEKVDKFTFPLLACNIDDVELSLIGWNPEPVPYDFYNLMFGCFTTPMRPERICAIERKRGSIISKSKSQFMAKGTTLVPEKQNYEKSIFSIVKQWQPEWVDKI